MKVRLTIMTENDRHPEIRPEDKEHLEKEIANAWDLILYMFCRDAGTDPSEKAFVEKCEIVEV